MCKRLVVLVSIIVLLGPAAMVSAVELKVDVGCPDQEAAGNLKEGWVAFNGTACEGAVEPVTVTDIGATGIDVTITVGDTSDNAYRSPSGYTGDEMGRDYVSADNGISQAECAMTMTLSNLPEAGYTLTSYHNCPDHPDPKATIDITVSGSGVVGTPTNATGVAQSILAQNVILDEIGKGTVQFVADGAGEVIVTFTAREEAHKWRVYLNGFELIGASLNPQMEFESSASADLETVSPAEVMVILKNPEEGQTYTVDYAATGGTATSGVDYALAGACVCDFDDSGSVNFRDLATIADNWLSQTPGNLADVTGDDAVNLKDFAVCALEWHHACGGSTLVFNPGQTSATIAIDIVDDGVDEDNETIELSLQNPTGPDATLGAKSQHTYTIVESEPSVGFEASSDTGREDTGAVAIDVSLSHVWSETVTVQYAVTGGTAAAGSDYNLSPGTLTFDPGQTTKTLNLSIVDDSSVEETETVVITLSNPTNATLGPITQYTYSILDNEAGLVWDGLVWYYSEFSGGPFVNAQGNLEWDPEKGGQFITRVPDRRLSQPGDVVEFAFMWMTDGDHDCPPNSCTVCDRCSGDITCIAGTSDLRVGLFEADGEYVDREGLGVFGSIFEGYKGYNFRFGPNMDPSIPPRWVDCDDEVHKTGNFCKKPEGEDNLMTYNRGEMDYIPGFGLTPGEYSFFRVQLKRTSSDSVRMEIELNGRVLSDTDNSGNDQPQKIDVFAVHMRNGREYNRLVLAKP